MHSNSTPVPTAPLLLLLKLSCSVLGHSVFYSKHILEDDQAPTFSGFVLSPLGSSFVSDKQNSFFIRNKFNKNLQLEPSSTSQKAFQIRFNSFDRSHSDFNLARSNLTFFFDTLQLLPSFNRDGSPLCSAAILEPVWIRKGPLTSFSRKLAPSAPTLVHDRCRSSDEGRHVPQFASIQAAQSHKPQSRRAYPTAMNCINRAKLTKVNPKKEWILFIIIVTRARANPHSNSLSLPTSTPLC